MTSDVTLIGFGEAGQAFAGAEGWRGKARVYDKLTDNPDTVTAKEADYHRAGVTGVPDLGLAVVNADLTLSLVTASQALLVAQSAAAWLNRASLFLDMNSVAPGTKQASAAAVEAAGGRYVDVAIMSPVLPARLVVPLLLSGTEASAAARELTKLGFSDVRVIGSRVGDASAIKMIRSVIVKGLEALTAEAMLAADAAGVTEEVLASLDASEKAQPWVKRAEYTLDRMIAHGLRRADEMEEAAKTLQDLGVEPAMTEGIVRRQREIGALHLGRPATGLSGKIDQIAGRKANAA